MRIGSGFGFVLLLASSLCAQVGTMGSVVHPAGGATAPGVTRSLGSVVNPAQGGTRVPVSGGHRGAPTHAASGYFYPVYIGSGYYTPYITQDSPLGAPPMAPSDSNVPPPTQQPVTPVIINYNYNYPVEVPAAPRAGELVQAQVEDSSAPEPSHYLIAFQDHTIYAATAYWVDGDTLHYFTAGNVHNQASLTLVDRDFTERLNKEAGVEVKLPAPSK